MTALNPLFRRAPDGVLPAPNPFERFGLKHNPFPDRPGVIPDNDDPRLNGSIYRADLRQAEQEKFERLLIPRPARPDADPMAFLMDAATRFGRGVGKTAFLNHQRQRIMADLGDALTRGSQVLFAVHILPPSDGRCRKFWQFCRLMGETMNDQGIVAQTLWRLRAFSDCIPESVLTQVGNDPQSTIGNNEWLAQQHVDVVGKLSPQVQRTLVNAGVDESLAVALAKHGHDPESFRQCFLQTLSEYRWRQQGGQWLFNDLVRAFRAAGFTRGLLLVDDFERIVVHQNSKERLSFIENIRYYFLDGPFESTRSKFYSVLWTIHPYVQELLVSHWNTAGMERFCALGGELAAEHTIDFRPLETQAAVPLVLEYLNRARLSDQDRDQLQPFDHEAVVEALRLVKGLPGFMLALLSRVMEHAVQSNWPHVDKDRIREVFQQEPPPPADEEVSRPSLPPAQVDLRSEE